jgi:hypothetical protein
LKLQFAIKNLCNKKPFTIRGILISVNIKKNDVIFCKAWIDIEFLNGMKLREAGLFPEIELANCIQKKLHQ